jgi:hypothetical protein
MSSDEREGLRDEALQAAYRVSARILEIRSVLGSVHEALIHSKDSAHSHVDAVHDCIRALAFAVEDGDLVKANLEKLGEHGSP